MITVLRRTAVLAACVLLSGLSVPLAHASVNRLPDPPPPGGNDQSTTYDLKNDEFSLTVSPTRLVVPPGDIGKPTEFLVVNRGQAAVPVTVQKRNFTGSPDGSLNYVDDAPYGAASWLTVSPESFVVEPGKAQVITATITVPPSPELGDHQVALVFLVEAGETEANIKVNRGVGVPMYITVPGPTDDSVALGGLVAPAFALGGPSIANLGGAVPVSTSLQNTGTVHRDFRDTEPLMIETAGAPASFPDFTVLRGSVRDVSTTWEPPFMCICNPTISVPSADGTLQQATARVVVFPLHWLALAIAAAVLVYFIIRWRRRQYENSVQRAAARMHPAGGNVQ